LSRGGRPGAGPWRPHWRAYAAEAAGTALLVFLGLSVVIFDFAPHLPLAALLPDALARRLLTGFVFGGIGALIAVSPLGRISGAHLDPVLSWAFWLAGSLGASDAALYTTAQAAGAVAGAALLPPVWGAAGAAVRYGMSLPAAGPGPAGAVAGEVAATFALVGLILWFSGRPALRRFTPAALPPLVAILVGVEAPWSGTSMNPARSLGPALVAHALPVMWIYVLGPGLGAALAALAAVRPGAVHVAKVGHHGHDPLGRFHGLAERGPLGALRRTAQAGRQEPRPPTPTTAPTKARRTE